MLTMVTALITGWTIQENTKAIIKKGLIKHRYSRRVSGYINIQITPTCINKSQPISHYKTSLFKPTWRRRKKTQIIHHRGKKIWKVIRTIQNCPTISSQSTLQWPQDNSHAFNISCYNKLYYFTVACILEAAHLADHLQLVFFHSSTDYNTTSDQDIPNKLKTIN